MNNKKNLKIFLVIMSLALLLNDGCVQFPKDRPTKSLKTPVAHYEVKPKIYFVANFSYVYSSLSIGGRSASNEDDKLKKIVEKVVKENELFDSYTFEADDEKTADYRIDFRLSSREKDPGQTPLDFTKGFLLLMSLGFFPVTSEMDFYLFTVVYDKSDKKLYQYYCEGTSTATQYSFIPPSEMIEKMVKEALFDVISNSGIMESYKLDTKSTGF